MATDLHPDGAHTPEDDRVNWEELVEAELTDEVRWNDRTQYAVVVDAYRDGMNNHVFEVEGPRGGEHTLFARSENPSFPYVEVRTSQGVWERVTSLDVRSPDES